MMNRSRQAVPQARLVRQDLRAMSWIAPKMVGRIPVAALANPPAIVELFIGVAAERRPLEAVAAPLSQLRPPANGDEAREAGAAQTAHRRRRFRV